MVTLVTCVTCIYVQTYKYLYNTILITLTREVTIPGNSLCLGSYPYREDTGIGYSTGHRLLKIFRQVEAEMLNYVSKKIQQTWGMWIS